MVIDHWEQRNIRLEKVLQKQFPKINIEFPTKKEDSIVDIYFGDIADTFSHRIQNKGYDLIKVTRRLNSLKQDTLSSRIIDFYLKNEPPLSRNATTLIRKTQENIKFFEQYSWYIDWLKHRYNKDAYIYFSESEVYRKKVASFQSSAIRNYLSRLIKYNTEAKKLITVIDTYSFLK